MVLSETEFAVLVVDAGETNQKLTSGSYATRRHISLRAGETAWRGARRHQTMAGWCLVLMAVPYEDVLILLRTASVRSTAVQHKPPTAPPDVQVTTGGSADGADVSSAGWADGAWESCLTFLKKRSKSFV